MVAEKYGDCFLCGAPLLDIEDLDDEICPTCHLWLREETYRCTKERLNMKPEQMPTNESIELAAQAWCDPTVSDRVMDGDLAIAFARIIDKVRLPIAKENLSEK